MILDKNVVVGPGEMVGVDLEKDRERFAISAGGVVAVGKGVWIYFKARANCLLGVSPAPSPQQFDERPHQQDEHNQHQRRYQDGHEHQTDADSVLNGGQHRKGQPGVVDVCGLGRTADFVSDTTSATTTPTTIGIHWPDCANAPGSVTAGVCAAVPEPKTMPPDVGRTNVWMASFTLSSAGILSATISTTSSTATIVSTQPFSSQA